MEKKVEELDLPMQDSDVQIDFIQREDESWFLRVTDKGIGMTADTIQKYFLRAGASFRQSPEWTREFVDDAGKVHVMRAGRFGIGMFTIFLLGPKFRLWTRHAGVEAPQGYYLEAEGDSKSVEIQKAIRPVMGTIVEIDIDNASAKSLILGGSYNESTDWFCCDWPVVDRRIIKKGSTKTFTQISVAPLCKSELPLEWSIIRPNGFDAVYWTFLNWPYYPKLICNGIRIGEPKSVESPYFAFNWPEEVQLAPPKVAIFDSAANLPLTIQRYALSDKNLPFINELIRDVILSFIAHALIYGPDSHTEAHCRLGLENSIYHPLSLYEKGGPNQSINARLPWCSSSRAVIPADPWLYSLMNADSCTIVGVFKHESKPFLKGNWQEFFSRLQLSENQTMMSWHDRLSSVTMTEIGTYLHKQCETGFQILGLDIVELKVLMSSQHGLPLLDHLLDSLNGDTPLLLPRKRKKEFKWFQIKVPETHHSKYFELKATTSVEHSSLHHLIEAMEGYYTNTGNIDDLLYLAQIKANIDSPQPETLLAKIWNECLGPNPIPFDPEARRALIERGRQHPQLKRHIEAWEEMQRTGSKWATDNTKD